MTAVSIIIPTFDRARTVGAAIDSALEQGPEAEVIVVDDGSTDETRSVLASYGNRIRALHQTNAGPGAARNLGAKIAGGEYLVFLDSDDTLEPGAILAMLERANGMAQHQVPFGLARTVDETGRPASGSTYGFPQQSIDCELRLSDLLGGVMPLCLLLLRRSFFLGLGGLRSDLRLGEDHEFALRLHGTGRRFVATRIPFTKVSLHSGPRLSSVYNPEHGSRLLQLLSLIADTAAAAPDFDGDAATALSKVVWVAARDAARCKERGPAKALFTLSLRLDPQAGRISPWPLRLASQVAGPYGAERLSELVKRTLLTDYSRPSRRRVSN